MIIRYPRVRAHVCLFGRGFSNEIDFASVKISIMCIKQSEKGDKVCVCVGGWGGGGGSGTLDLG